MASIRGRLVCTLTGLFVLVWLAVVAVTYVVARQRIETLFDEHLEHDARVLLALSKDGAGGRHVFPAPPGVSLQSDQKAIAFSIWQSGHLVVRSAVGPRLQHPHRPGFADLSLSEQQWRSYSVVDPERQLAVQVGEPYTLRNKLAVDMIHDALFPLFWAAPVLGIAIWFGVGRGLSPLKRAAEQISTRSPENLEQVDLRSAPREIHVLVRTINSLLMLLQEAFDRERHFTADASHEIRTPLAAVKAHAQLAQRSTDEKQRKHALQQIVANADRMAHLIEQLLTLARMDRESLDSRREQVNLSALATELVTELQPEARARGLRLSTDARFSTTIPGSAPALRIMIRNLLTNALRHARNAVVVGVCEGDSGDACLQIEDDGPGIPESYRRRVFDRFYRGQGQRSEGCGLGLSIVRRIVGLHQAQITLSESTMGGLRASVHFQMPASEASLPAHTTERLAREFSPAMAGELPGLPQE